MRHYISLKNRTEFGRVYRCGKSFANKYLVIYIAENDGTDNRLGISVSKKVGNSVVRHRLTRLVREAFRLNKDRLLKGYDIVVILRNGAEGCKYQEIESAFLHLCKLHHILAKRAEE